MAMQPEEEITDRSPQGRYIRFNTRLGSGAYKTVYKAYDTREGIEVAWNQVDIASMPKAEKNRIIQEVKLLQTLEHKNIINFHGSWVNREKQQVVFITEIVTSGTLSSFIKRVQLVRWKIIRRWCRQILEGLKYLHSHNPPIIHRDLKCDNIFINGSTGDLRIGDLGLSTQMAVGRNAQSVLGTPEFMAPELYDENYDEKVDIYAFGMCVLEMITKQIPYMECVNPAQIYKKVTAGIRPAALQRVKNKGAKEFIELCLSRGGGLVDVTAEYLLSSPFLQEGPDDDEEVIVDNAPEPARPHTGSLDHDVDDEVETSEFEDRKNDFPGRSRRGSIPVTRSVAVDGSLVRGGSGASEEEEHLYPLAPQSDVYHPVDAEGILEAMSDVEPSVRSRQMTIMSGRGEVLQEPDTRPESQWGLSPVVKAARAAEAAKEADARSFMALFQKQSEPKDQLGDAVKPPAAPADSKTPRDSLQAASTSSKVQGPTPSDGSGKTLTSVAGESESQGSIGPAVTGVPPVEGAKRRKAKHEIKSLPDPEHENSILLLLRVYLEGRSKEIKFSFNLYTDSPHEVSCELSFDVGIPESEVEDIAHSIAYLVTEGKNKRYEKGHIDIWDDAPEPHPFNYRPVGRAQGSGPILVSMGSDASTLPPNSPGGRSQGGGVAAGPPTLILGPPAGAAATDYPSLSPALAAPLPEPLMTPVVTIPDAVSVPLPSAHTPLAAPPRPSEVSPGLPMPETALSSGQAAPGQGGSAGPSSGLSVSTDMDSSKDAGGSLSPIPGNLAYNVDPSSPTFRLEGEDISLHIKKKEYERQLKVATSAFDRRDYSLEQAMKDEEEKHRKEMERHRKRMEEFQKKKQRAMAMREQRLMKFEADWKEQVHNVARGLSESSGSPGTASPNYSGNVTPTGAHTPLNGLDFSTKPPVAQPQGGNPAGPSVALGGTGRSLSTNAKGPAAFDDLLQHPMVSSTPGLGQVNGLPPYLGYGSHRSTSVPSLSASSSATTLSSGGMSGNWAGLLGTSPGSNGQGLVGKEAPPVYGGYNIQAPSLTSIVSSTAGQGGNLSSSAHPNAANQAAVGSLSRSSSPSEAASGPG